MRNEEKKKARPQIVQLLLQDVIDLIPGLGTGAASGVVSRLSRGRGNAESNYKCNRHQVAVKASLVYSLLDILNRV